MATYRGYEIVEQVDRLGLTDEPGIWYSQGFQGPRDVVERWIDKEIALAKFRAAHGGLMPWQAQDYGFDVDPDLLAVYVTADRAFVDVDRPYREAK